MLFFWYIPIKDSVTQSNCEVIYCKTRWGYIGGRYQSYSDITFKELTIKATNTEPSLGGCPWIGSTISCYYYNYDPEDTLTDSDPILSSKIGIIILIVVTNLLLICIGSCIFCAVKKKNKVLTENAWLLNELQK